MAPRCLPIYPRRGITIRHVVSVLASSMLLWTIYRVSSNESEIHLTEEHVPFWLPESSDIWADRAAQVKNAFLHAYRGYERYAFPHDELRPVSNGSIDK